MADHDTERLLSGFADHLLKNRLADGERGTGGTPVLRGETAGEMRGEETTTDICSPGVCQESDTSASCVPQQNEATLRRIPFVQPLSF